MKIRNRKFQLLAASVVVGAGLAGPAQAALDISGLAYVTYDDANSYALQISGVVAGSTGPGSPFYVNSTPGAIQDLIVVATGSNGGPVNTNVAGMDNALSTPTGVSGSNYFSGIWNSTLAAFKGFLGIENPLFFFNNNQINSGASTNQQVAVWAQVSVTGTSVATQYLTFSNLGAPYALFTEGGGGVGNGTAGGFTVAGINASAASLPDPLAGTNARTDYVLSGGAICLTTAAAIPFGFPLNTAVSCTSPVPHGAAIDNNLGANQAAYALDAPALNTFLAGWNSASGYTDIHVELRFGCDPLTAGGGIAGIGNCIGRDANNGFEQLFIGTSTSVTQVPEPGILGLLALGMLGLAATARRRKV